MKLFHIEVANGLVYSTKVVMCINVPRKVIRLNGGNALLDDGRTVRIGTIQDIHIGDTLEVYGDIALGNIRIKIDPVEKRKVSPQ